MFDSAEALARCVAKLNGGAYPKLGSWEVALKERKGVTPRLRVGGGGGTKLEYTFGAAHSSGK